MKQNQAGVSSHTRVFRVSLALAFALSPLGAMRLAVGQTPSPDIPVKAETIDVSTLTLPSGWAVPASVRPIASLRPAAKLGQAMGGEIEPNGYYTQASAITSGTTVRASIYPNADVDFYAFTARAGDRVFAAIMGSFSTGSTSTNDSQLTLLASDGVTVIEFDDDNGTLGSLSSSIAGALIPSAGTYYLKVNHFSLTNQLRPYELHFRVQSGAPTPEVEGNDTPATANVLAAGGWMSGARNPAGATEQDWYSATLAAGDTVFLSLDLDPERDGVTWNGRLGFALFGDAGNQILVVDDGGATETPTPTIPSEALFITVKNAGTYYAFVDSATAATGGLTATYHLSVDIKPAVDEGPVCAIYTSTDVPKALGPATGLFSSTITVPGRPRIADLDVTINLTHALMADLDVHLRSPAGNDNGLFTDIGAAAIGGQTQMDTTFDDEAGAPPTFTVLKGLTLKPELAHRLAWFDGEDAGGTWTLVLGDDFPNASGGTLISWSLRICEPPPPPTCQVGYALSTIFSTDFETNDAGFTHAGTADEWAYGTPATLATTTANPIADFSTCSSGMKCWKTDLSGTYNASSNQDLFSLPISLVTVTAPIQVSWAQRYQIENASFDRAFVDIQQVGGATPARLWEWLDATMTNAPFSPTVNIGASAGWGIHTGRADGLAGTNAQLRFHVDSDTTVNFGGLAIDDVTVQGCVAVPRMAYLPRVLR